MNYAEPVKVKEVTATIDGDRYFIDGVLLEDDEYSGQVRRWIGLSNFKRYFSNRIPLLFGLQQSFRFRRHHPHRRHSGPDLRLCGHPHPDSGKGFFPGGGHAAPVCPHHAVRVVPGLSCSATRGLSPPVFSTTCPGWPGISASTARWELSSPRSCSPFRRPT